VTDVVVTVSSWIYNNLCNQCLSPLKLGARIPLMTRCTQYNIICKQYIHVVLVHGCYFIRLNVSNVKIFHFIFLHLLINWLLLASSELKYMTNTSLEAMCYACKLWYWDMWLWYVCFVDRCLSFCTFSFGHCVVCSSIYGFWLSSSSCKLQENFPSLFVVSLFNCDTITTYPSCWWRQMNRNTWRIQA
jgi:hypothetical protein